MLLASILAIFHLLWFVISIAAKWPKRKSSLNKNQTKSTLFVILNGHHSQCSDKQDIKNMSAFTPSTCLLLPISFSRSFPPLSPALCQTGQHVINGSGGWFRMLMWYLIKLIAPNGSPRSSGEGLSITAVRLHPSHSAWQCHFTFSLTRRVSHRPSAAIPSACWLSMDPW